MIGVVMRRARLPMIAVRAVRTGHGAGFHLETDLETDTPGG
jgi:hypothetical protein